MPIIKRRTTEAKEIPAAAKKVIPSLSQKAEWENYFDTEKNKVLAIQSQINSTDTEIDKMGYQLYGLTEEEIAIVEKG